MSEPTTARRPLVELVGIRKAFGDLVVNDGVELSVLPGEVHALLGENGAGKTTLMRILYGLTAPDAGEIRIDGEPVRISSPADAMRHRIGMVTQHFSLVGPMTVTENVMLAGVGYGRLDRAAARRSVVAAAERIGVTVDPDARVNRLSVGEQQRVEILKALTRDCRVLILDEPTAVLVPQDVEALFTSIRRLTEDGMGVLFISHKLGEVCAISQRVSVLRRGVIAGTEDTADVDPRRLAELMVGRSTVGVRRDRGLVAADDEVGEAIAVDAEAAAVIRDDQVLADAEPVDPASPADGGATLVEPGAIQPDAPAMPLPRKVSAPALRIRGLRLAGFGSGRDVLDSIDLDVAPGEIVGMAGVSGNGQTELVQVLSGVLKPTAGSIEVDGAEITGLSPRKILQAGLGRITEDRHASVVGKLTVEQNLVLEDSKQFRKGPFLDRRAIRAHAQELIQRFGIKAAPTDPIASLSGGNMQKVLLARSLARNPIALVAAQPTRGLDVGAAEFVHTELIRRRAEGGGILLISEDLEELLALADRLVVIYAGRIVGDLSYEEATPDRLGLLMSGHETDVAVA